MAHRDRSRYHASPQKCDAGRIAGVHLHLTEIVHYSGLNLVLHVFLCLYYLDDKLSFVGFRGFFLYLQCVAV